MARIDPAAILEHLRAKVAAVVLEVSRLAQGFYGASSMERLSTEIALAAQTQIFMALKRARD